MIPDRIILETHSSSVSGFSICSVISIALFLALPSFRKRKARGATEFNSGVARAVAPRHGASAGMGASGDREMGLEAQVRVRELVPGHGICGDI